MRIALYALLLASPWLVVALAHGDGPATRPAVPPAADQARAQRLIHELFRKEYAGTAADDRRQLARLLLAESAKMADDPAARYVLLAESRQAAAACGDIDTLLAVVTATAASFDVDAAELAAASLTSAAKVAGDAATHERIAQAAMRLMDDLAAAERFDPAIKLGAVAEASAARAERLSLFADVQSRTRDLRILSTERDRARQAARVLLQKPDDAEASAVLGRYLCLSRGQWVEGLVLLSKGGDGALGTLARRDIANPAQAQQQLALANAWWDLAEQHAGVQQRHLRQRAAHWYRLAIPSLKGLEKSLAEKRAAEAGSGASPVAAGTGPTQAGLQAELFKGIDFQTSTAQRVDGQIDFDWGEGAPDPAVGKDNFSIRWTGFLNAPAAGQYTLVLIANSNVRLTINGQQLFEGDIYRKRSGHKLPVTLKAGPNAFRLEFWDTTGVAKMRLLWIPPGQEKETVIPAEAFTHTPAK
mgnify:CR=1 FL=1